LVGYRILDLTRVLAGPFCTMVLADLGAEIIKVEEPAHGDDARSWGPPFVGRQSAYFLGVNRTKKSVGLNLRDPRGQKLLAELASRSDVLIENFRTGAMDRWGLGYDVLSKTNPRLVYCSITGFGPSRPYRDLPGYDTIVEALGGLMSITGPPEGPPYKVGVAIVDVVTGLFCSTAILAALHARDQTRRGQRIDVSLMDVALASLVNVGASYLASGVPPERFGNDHMSIAPFGMLEAADGHVMLAVGNDGQWRSFCSAIGRFELARDDRFATNERRVTNRTDLARELSQTTVKHTVVEWCERLMKAGVPVAPVRSVAEALDEEQSREGGLIQSAQHPTIGTVRMVGSPLQLSLTPVRPPEAPPLLGEDTGDVLGNLLGIGTKELAELEAAGVVTNSAAVADTTADKPVGSIT
jgi:crotonobetainyl-CoA:carnitine CoA-transferase CaiB-like acyl-CoA transferase